MVRAWRWVRIIAPLYLIGCLLILWDVCGGFGHVAPEVKVPSLQRLSVTTATERLQSLGIAVIIVDGDRSDGYSQGMVMEQSVPAGVHVRAGRHIYLVVCRGPLHVRVPDLRGSSSTDALRALVALGLQPAVAASTPDDKVPFDCIVSESPPPTTRLEVGAPVSLVVSDGPTGSGFDDAGVDTGLPGVGRGYPGEGYPGVGYPGDAYSTTRYSGDTYVLSGDPGADSGMDSTNSSPPGTTSRPPRRRRTLHASPDASGIAPEDASPEWEPPTTAASADSTPAGESTAQFGANLPPNSADDLGSPPAATPRRSPPAVPPSVSPSASHVIVRTNLPSPPAALPAIDPAN